MIYKAYIKAGEGCDYSIACGMKIINLKSDSMAAAISELRHIIEEEYSYDERLLDSAVIYEVSREYPIDIDAVYSDINDKKRQTMESEKDRLEREEFERLKRKFGNS